MHLPYPPPPLPFLSIAVPAKTWFRVHRYDEPGHYDPDQFNDTRLGDARFSPLLDPLTDQVIPTLYVSSSSAGAIAEVVLHDVPIPSAGHSHDWEADRSGYLHMSLLSIGPLSLANLTSTGLRAAGLRPADLFAGERPDYARTRSWALFIWQHVPDVHGLLWMSVRDTRHEVALLFEDRVKSGDAALATSIAELGGPTHIRHHESEVFELLDLLGCGLIPR